MKTLTLIIILSAYIFPQRFNLLLNDGNTVSLPTWTWVLEDVEEVGSIYSLRKTGVVDGYNAQAYSVEGYTNNITLSFTAHQTDKYVIMGISSNPSLDQTNAFQYGWFLFADGANQVYFSGVGQGSGSVSGSYNAGDIFKITYDGTSMKFYKNNVLAMTVEDVTGTTWYIDSSFYSADAQLDDIMFTGE